jgi:hypothetical protein
MTTFVFTYRAPDNYVRGTAGGVAAWTAWFDSMGAAVVDMGKPVAESATVGDCGDGTRPLDGYSLVAADDLDAALALAKGCPFVGLGGGVEVGELLDLPGAPDPA